MAGLPAGRGRLIAVAVVGLVLVLGGGYAVLAARGSDSPPPAALDDTPAPTTAAPQGQGRTGSSTPDGGWRVKDDGSSFVGYRVQEQLAFLQSPNQAVGRSTVVTGTMQVAGQQVRSVRVEADLTRLTSDESRRDNAIRRNGLESERFPTATFELTGPLRLDGRPQAGREVSGTGKGRLTVHGVTREVDLDLKGRWSGDTIQVAGQLPVKMTDYDIQPPQIGPVVAIEDELTVEFRLNFEPA